MLLIDSRGGSCELVAPLAARGLPVLETTFPSGDLCFEGRGEKGAPVQVGVEFKKLGEFVSSLRTQRLQGHQLVEMRQAYDHSWLLIEGELLYDAQGFLQRRSSRDPRVLKPMPGGMTVSELLKRVYVLHLCGGLSPIWTNTRKDTLLFLEMLYRVWTDQDLDKHKSHLAIYNAPPLRPVSEQRHTLATYPGVGFTTSKAAEARFGSVRAASNATVKQWSEVDGVGPKKATAIVDFLRKDARR